MKAAVLLLVILAAACAGGSFITQGQTYAWYASVYSERTAGLIIALGLDDVFHAWWFIILAAFLCINLLACNLLRVPSLVKRTKITVDPDRLAVKSSTVQGTMSGDTHEFFKKMGFGRVQEGKDSQGRAYIYGSANKAGLWGAWICHLGILILILGFGAGEMLTEEYTVYGVPGQSKQIGETPYLLTIDDFEVTLREDDTVEQYTGSFTVSSSEDGSRESLTASVNHPAEAYGMKFYQNSMGWAATLHVAGDGEDLQTEIVCQGESVDIEAVEGLTIYLQGVYPNYYQDEQGMPATDGTEPTNPGYLYRAVYNGQVQQMNVLYGEEYTNEILVDKEYRIWFDDPRYYTLIQVKRDPYEMAALLGGIIVVIGLLLCFYVHPKEMWAVEEDGRMIISGYSRKGGALFAERFKTVLEGSGGSILQETSAEPGKQEEQVQETTD